MVFLASAVILGSAIGPFWGCAQSTKLDLTEKLTVAMQGVFEAPVDATGNADPKFEKFTLSAVTAVDSDGTSVNLYEDDPKEFRIISRPQIIFEADISDYVDKSFNTVALTFDPTTTVGGKIESDLAVALTDASPMLTDTFTVEKAKGLRLDVKVQWKNTVTRDEDADPASETASSPTFTLEMTSK